MGSRVTFVKTFISCHRTPRPRKGFRRVLEGVPWRGLWRVSEGFLKGFRRVLEGVSRGPLQKPFKNPSETLQRPFRDPFRDPFRTLLKPFRGRGSCGRKWKSWHFWVNFRSLWVRSARVTFESLLGCFNNSFCVSVELGAHWLHNLSIPL